MANMKHPFLASLEAVGLLESEAAVYLAALEVGPASSQVIVERCGFSRPATYVAIESLVQKGLLSSQVKGKRLLYSAESPDRLIEYGQSQVDGLQAKVADLGRRAAELELLRKGDRPSVKFFEGLEGLKSVMHDIVTSSPKELLEFADLDAVKQVLSLSDLEGLQTILSKRKTKGRAILVGATRVRQGIVGRVLPRAEYPFSGDLLIYGDKVVSITFSGKVQCVMMQGMVMAEMYRAFFDLAWKGADGYPELRGV